LKKQFPINIKHLPKKIDKKDILLNLFAPCFFVYIQAVVGYIREAEKEEGAVKSPAPEMVETMDYFMEVETFADNLEIPWAIDFINKNTALITERTGRLRIVKNGALQAEAVKNTPQVLHEGQGGLLDVAVDPEYEENGWIYLDYSHELKEYEGNRPPAMTRLVRGKIENNPHAGNGATQLLLETLHCRLRA